MHRFTSSIRAFIRASIIITSFSLAAASGAQAAVLSRLPARPVTPSPMWTLSHLNALHISPQRAASGAGSARTLPLSGPWGLSVASNGDLYVANLLANQVLIYSSNLAQKTSSTISTGLAHPTDVAFDSMGELYVSNFASSAITVYTSSHAYLPNRTIVNSVNKPVSIAIDGLNDLYVDEDYAAVGVFDFFQNFTGNIPLPGLGTINAVTQRAQRIAFAGSNQVQLFSTLQTLDSTQTGNAAAGNMLAAYALGAAFDANGNLYYVTGEPAVNVLNTQNGVASKFATPTSYRMRSLSIQTTITSSSPISTATQSRSTRFPGSS